MITRREMNTALAAMFAAILSEGPGALMRAEAPPKRNTQGHPGNSAGVGVQTLMQEPLAAMPNAVVRVITLTVAPGANSSPHEHTGPVFAYLLEGEIENQVDPNPPRRFKPGEYFYEPPMHVHRMLRNLSDTKPAKLLIFQVEEKGKQFTLRAK